MNHYFKSINYFQSYLNEMLHLNNLQILSINIRSISSLTKFNKFKTLIATFSKLPSIICIQETWFQHDIVDLYTIPGYNNIHCCRSDGYGGTSVYIHKDINYSVELCESVNYIESIVISLNDHKICGKALKLMTFYRSQKCHSNTFSDYIDYVLSVFGRYPFISTGDSNMDFLNMSLTEQLNTIIDSYDCVNCHTFVTRPASGTSIDNVFSNLHNKLLIDVVECDLSDHNFVFCRLESHIKTKDLHEFVRNNCDYGKMKIYIRNNMSALTLTGDPSDDMSKFVSFLSNAMSFSTTEIKKTQTFNNEMAPWINGNLQSLLKLKKKLLAQRRANSTSEINSRLRRISKVIKIATRDEMNLYYRNKLSKINLDPKKCWRFLNQTLGRTKKSEVILKDDGGFITSDSEKAEKLNQYFIKSVCELRQQIHHHPGESWHDFWSIRRHCNFLRLQQTTATEIREIICNMDLHKAPGFDNILPKLFVECGTEVIPVLVKIFNSSINNSVYPDLLKIQKVIPIPKETHANSVTKYRPISLLSTIDKIFEKIINRQLESYLEGELLLSDNQYGFRKGCGTGEAVVNVVNYICKCLDDGYAGVGAIFYDFSKAFELVDHTVLIEKLAFYGLMGRELGLLKSYLSNRRQYVQINEYKSSTEHVKYGVPQGSVLGPLLFKIYLNDINNIGMKGKIFMYADDLCIFYPYTREMTLKSAIAHDSELLTKYARINKLVLNSNKTKFIKFRPQQQRCNDFIILSDGERVPEVNTVKYLGVYLQSNLSWKNHIQHVKSKISPVIGILYKLRNKLDENTKLMIFEALVQSHINYLSMIYAHRRNIDLKSLQIVQNKCLKNVYKLPRMYPTLQLYRDVAKTVLPVYGLHKMQQMVYIYKVLNKIGYHTIQFEIIHNNTRQNSNIRVVRCRLETTKQRIEYNGSLEYNSLPSSVKNSETISLFKSRLKIHLLQNIEMLLI